MNKLREQKQMELNTKLQGITGLGFYLSGYQKMGSCEFEIPPQVTSKEKERQMS